MPSILDARRAQPSSENGHAVPEKVPGKVTDKSPGELPGRLRDRLRGCVRDNLRDRATICAMGLSSTLFLAFITSGYLAAPDDFAREVSGLVGEVHNSKNAAQICGLILAVNLSTMLFLYAGVVSLGLFTIVSLFLSGAFLGISIKVAVAHDGVWDVLSHTFLYTPWEVSGFIIAGAAGFYPCVRALVLKDASLISGQAMRRSLVLLATASVVLLFAAIIESLSIVILQ